MYKSIRQRNLRRLINEISDGRQIDFAERIGKSPSYVGQLVRGVGSFGDRVARQIEQQCGKPRGWLDSDAQAPASPRHQRLCPLLSWVAAGSFHDMHTPDGSGDDAEEWMACPVSHGPRTFVLQVRGESMFNPVGRLSFADGDFIFVDPDRRPENKSCVIVRQDGASTATFKQLIFEGEPPAVRPYLKPLNPAWPEPIIEMKDDAELCGTVIYKGVAL